MKFTAKILLLGVADRAFKNTDGENVAYWKATFIDENAQVYSISTTKEVLDTVGDKSRVDGEGSFEIKADNKTNPRVKLIAFAIKK